GCIDGYFQQLPNQWLSPTLSRVDHWNQIRMVRRWRLPDNRGTRFAEENRLVLYPHSSKRHCPTRRSEYCPYAPNPDGRLCGAVGFASHALWHSHKGRTEDYAVLDGLPPGCNRSVPESAAQPWCTLAPRRP